MSCDSASSAPEQNLVGIAKLAASGRTLDEKQRVEYRELPTRQWINRVQSSRVFFGWSINPYRGCEYGCQCCFARYTHEFLERHGQEAFETEIFAKSWDETKFREELRRVAQGEAIGIGTATDPYQPAERKYGLTRRVLIALTKERGLRVYVTTKSDLIARDVELLARIAEQNTVAVSMTVTTMERPLARLLEPYAPCPELRIRALQKLTSAGVPAGVIASPVLPLLTDSEENLAAVAAAAAEAGAHFFTAGVLFLKPCARRVFYPFLKENFPELLGRYIARYAARAFLDGDYPAAIAARIKRVRERYGLARRTREVVVRGEQLRLF